MPTIQLDGRALEVQGGEPLDIALIKSGVVVIASSTLYRRPRGFVGVEGWRKQNLVYVKGRGWVNPCSIRVEDGLVAETLKGSRVLQKILRIYPQLLHYGVHHNPIIRNQALWPIFRAFIGRALLHPKAEAEGFGRKTKLMDVDVDVLVVGGGPAGLSAASKLSQRGLKVLLVDDGEDLGGRLRYDRSPIPVGDGVEQAQELVGRLKGRLKGVQILTETSLTAFFEDATLLQSAEGFIRVRAKIIIFATGARDAPLIFKNNDLPGVYPASYVLRLLHFGVKPGERGIVVGANDWGFRLAAQLMKAGVDVAVVDPYDKIRAQSMYVDGASKAGIRVWLNTRLVEARGWSRVKKVVLECEGSSYIMNVDFICLALSRYPCIEAPLQAGVDMKYSEHYGLYIPNHNPYGETNLENILVAGSIVGCNYEYVNMLMGEASALTALIKLGYRDVWDERERLVKEAGRIREKFEERHGRPSLPEAWVSGRIDDTAFLCFCWDITAKDLLYAIKRGAWSMEKVKRCIGVGTGLCQGKQCMVNTALLLAHLLKKSPDEVGLFRQRPPLQPLPLSALSTVGGGV